MEEAVYLCSWSKNRDGYSLWVVSRPRLRGAAPTYAEAEERLLRSIRDSGEAIVAVLEFDPPLPKSTLEAKYAVPEVYLICGDDRFQTDLPGWHPFQTVAVVEAHSKEIDAYYQSPICRKCHRPVGPRNDRQITLSYAHSRYDGAFGSIGKWGTTSIQLLSETFLELLTSEERSLLELRPTQRKGRGRKFFELIGPGGPPMVAVSGLKITGWRCTKCDYRVWAYWIEGLSIQKFIAKSDLPSSLPGVFTVGNPPEIRLVATGARWKQLVGRKGTRGFTSRILGIVPDHEVIRSPELPTYKERLRKAAEQLPGS